MSWTLLVLALAPLETPPETPATEAPRVLVLDLAAVATDEENARLVSGVVGALAGECEGAQVVTGADVRTMLTLSADRQAAGCDDNSCLVELADALDAKFVIYGDVGALGENTVVTLNLFDAASGASKVRRSVEVASIEQVPTALRPVVAQLLAPLGGIPTAAQTKGQPMLLVGAGTAAVGGAVLLGCGVATLIAEGIVSEPTNAVEDKQAAVEWGRAAFAGTLTGLAIAGAGAAIVAADLFLE